MRTMDRREQEQHEADELAAEAFDRYPPEIEAWVRDAFVGEWGEPAESAAKQVMWAAVALNGVAVQYQGESVARLRMAVGNLREAYIDHASVQGLYAAEAADAVNNAISDEAERLQDMADDRNIEAYQTGTRG